MKMTSSSGDRAAVDFDRTTIAAQPGWSLRYFGGPDDKMEFWVGPPKQIIAWVVDVRIDQFEPETRIQPVTYQGVYVSTPHLIVAPDGRVSVPLYGDYTTLEAATDALRRMRGAGRARSRLRPDELGAAAEV
jgi:hypothetical protein